jgi:hypothetical protein
MSRIRTIKPSFWNDAKVVKLSFEIRLLFIGTWNFADDYGYLWDDAEQIHRDVFPADPNVDVAGGLARLLVDGLLESFPTTQGRHALHIRNWDEHQYVDRRKASVIARYVEALREGSRLFDVEGKGREGKGLSEGGASPSAPASPAKDLVSYYIKECKARGYTPADELCGQLGSKAKRLLAEKPVDLIESAIRVIADERKSPSALALVIADLEAGRSANAGPA